MPYRHAHYFVLALLPAAVLAFWFQFFSNPLGAGPAIHLHSWSATLWLLLLAGQSWSIHHERFWLHRLFGRLSLALFPAFLAGFFVVIQSEAQTVIDGDPYRIVFAPGIGVLTLVAIVAIAILYFGGLKNRRTPQLHARYMLAIPFLFAESILGRIFNGLAPGLIVNSPEDVRNVYWAIHLSQALAILFALVLYFQKPKFGAPFLVLSLALVLQSIGLEVFDDIGWWRDLYLASADLPFAAPLGIGLIIGILIVWRGWMAGGAKRVLVG
ncbi:MAG: hypothetical protein GC152_05300 [Alphaproteobacteria bacterium]|nr:hypothetical protein [Alphaproteobacteria bacterium]